MDFEQTARELNQMHIENARLLSQVAASLSTSGEAGVLLWLNQRTGETFATDIIDHFCLTPGRVANIVKKLEKRGYLVRRQNIEDLRKAHIFLTPEGKEYADKLFEEMTANHVRVLEALGEEDASNAMRILSKLITII